MPRAVRIGVDARLLSGYRSGIARYLYNILEQWEFMGIDAQVYLYADEGFDWPYKNPRWHLRVRRPPFFMPVTCWWFSYGAWRMMKDKIDVLWSPWPVTPFFMPIKKAVTVHDFVWKCFPGTMNWKIMWLLRLFGDISLRRADIIFPVSSFTAKDLKRYFPGVKNIHIAFNAASACFKAIDRDKARAFIADKYSLSGKFILSVGTIEPRKNLGGLIRAFRKFRDMGGPDCKLVIIGAYGWKSPGLFSLCKNLDLGGDIIFTGYVEDEDLVNFYNAAEFFVHPSLHEGFGIIILESMACGCPVIASNRPAMPEVAGDAALFIDPEDTDDIARKMFRMMAEDALRQEYCLKGLERAKIFSWSSTAEIIFKALSESVARGKNSQ